MEEKILKNKKHGMLALTLIIAGYILDFILRKDVNEEDDFEIEVDGICGCSNNSFINAFTKTFTTIAFIFLINLGLGLIIHFVGEDALANTLSVHPFIQPIIATTLGFIPNCAISIVLVQSNDNLSAFRVYRRGN